MLTKKTIVIIGAGSTGRSIAHRLAGGHFNLLLCDKEHTKSEALAKEIKQLASDTEAEAMKCAFNSAWESDIIILAMNFQSQKEVAVTIKDVVNQKILISINEPAIETTARFSSTAGRLQYLQDLLPNTSIAGFDIDPNEILLTCSDNATVSAVTLILESAGINFTRIEYLYAHAQKNYLRSA